MGACDGRAVYVCGGGQVGTSGSRAWVTECHTTGARASWVPRGLWSGASKQAVRGLHIDRLAHGHPWVRKRERE